MVVSEVSHRAGLRSRRRGKVRSGSTLSTYVWAHLHLGVGPSWDLNDHVHDSLLLVGVERDIVEWRDWLAIALNVDAVLQGVWGTNLADGILDRGHICGISSSSIDTV